MYTLLQLSPLTSPPNPLDTKHLITFLQYKNYLLKLLNCPSKLGFLLQKHSNNFSLTLFKANMSHSLSNLAAPVSPSPSRHGTPQHLLSHRPQLNKWSTRNMVHSPFFPPPCTGLCLHGSPPQPDAPCHKENTNYQPPLPPSQQTPDTSIFHQDGTIKPILMPKIIDLNAYGKVTSTHPTPPKAGHPPIYSSIPDSQR